MKIIFILSFSFLLANSTFSQIITPTVEKSILIGKAMSFECEKNEGKYVFTYRNYRYTQITSFKSFTLNETDFNDLFNLIEKGFNEKPAEAIKFETPEDILYLRFPKSFGMVKLQMTHLVNKDPEETGSTRNLRKKQVIKIFGKKK